MRATSVTLTFRPSSALVGVTMKSKLASFFAHRSGAISVTVNERGDMVLARARGAAILVYVRHLFHGALALKIRPATSAARNAVTIARKALRGAAVEAPLALRGQNCSEPTGPQ